jgi:hypothetical protein
MTRRTVIIMCAIAVGVFLIVYEFLSLYNTPWRPFLFLELTLLCAFLVVVFIFRYDWQIGNFFEWMTRPPTKPPDFSCARCQSIRVITHERSSEGGFVHRRFWCKDCGYEWSHTEAIPDEGDSTEPKTDLK